MFETLTPNNTVYCHKLKTLYALTMREEDIGMKGKVNYYGA